MSYDSVTGYYSFSVVLPADGDKVSWVTNSEQYQAGKDIALVVSWQNFRHMLPRAKYEFRIR